MIDKGWIEAGNLTESDVLLCSNGSYCKIDCISIERFDYYIDVYNFEVEQFHTYFVGENSIFVHNAACGGMNNLRLLKTTTVGDIMKNKIVYEKLNEDDILEIVMEHLQEKHGDFPFSKIVILGEIGKDLRCICALSKKVPRSDLNLIEIDKKMEFTGDHAFLEQHPEFLL